MGPTEVVPLEASLGKTLGLNGVPSSWCCEHKGVSSPPQLTVDKWETNTCQCRSRRGARASLRQEDVLVAGPVRASLRSLLCAVRLTELQRVPHPCSAQSLNPPQNHIQHVIQSQLLPAWGPRGNPQPRACGSSPAHRKPLRKGPQHPQSDAAHRLQNVYGHWQLGNLSPQGASIHHHFERLCDEEALGEARDGIGREEGSATHVQMRRGTRKQTPLFNVVILTHFKTQDILCYLATDQM
nr:uncharacterized protein LOC106031940 [Anser cygnoides]